MAKTGLCDKGIQEDGSNETKAITPAILRQLKRVWEAKEDSFNGCMLWAAACMCFFGFLRTGEVVVPSLSLYDAETHLSTGDIKLDSTDKPTCLMVHIKASKTDIFRKGNTVYLGIMGTELCPVAAIVNYMVLPKEQARSMAFFGFSDGRPLTRDLFVRELRSALAAVGIEAEKFAGHSFRIGAADSLIQTLGRWESSAYTLYIRTPPSVLCSVTRTLAEAQ